MRAQVRAAILLGFWSLHTELGSDCSQADCILGGCGDRDLYVSRTADLAGTGGGSSGDRQHVDVAVIAARLAQRHVPLERHELLPLRSLVVSKCHKLPRGLVEPPR